MPIPFNPPTLGGTPWNVLSQKSRNSPLNAGWLNKLYANQKHIINMYTREHLMDGSHNALEVPVALGQIDNSAGTYSVDTSSVGVSSVTKNAVGDVTVTFTASLFGGSKMAVLLAPQGSSTLPYTLSYKIVSSNQIEVFQNANTTGNSWAATDGTFFIAVFSQPRSPASQTIVSPPNMPQAGQTLMTDDGNGLAWNDFVGNEGQLFNALTTGHLNAGSHNIRQIARDYAIIKGLSTGPTYLARSGNISTISRSVAVGVVIYTITLANPPYGTQPQFFVNPGINESTGKFGDLNQVNVLWQASPAQVNLYLQQYNPSTKTWAGADFDVDLVLHAAPASIDAQNYVKLPKARQDYCLGYQTINGAINNEQAFYNLLTAEHYDANNWQGMRWFGHHNVATIPRWVGEYVVTNLSTLQGGVASTILRPNVVSNGFIPSLYAASITRLGAGQYFIASPQLGSTYWAIPQAASASGSNLYFMAARRATNNGTYGGNTGGTQNGFYVYCWQLVSGDWVLADPPEFTVTVWST